MLAGERKLFAMRTFRRALAAAAVVVCATPAFASVKYASPQAAFEQGLGAYKAGYYEIAIPALEEAAKKGPSPTPRVVWSSGPAPAARNEAPAPAGQAGRTHRVGVERAGSSLLVMVRLDDRVGARRRSRRKANRARTR